MFDCVFTEMFQLVALHLPRSGEQLVEARELSAVLADVSANPAAISFGRMVCTQTQDKNLFLDMSWMPPQIHKLKANQGAHVVPDGGCKDRHC